MNSTQIFEMNLVKDHICQKIAAFTTLVELSRFQKQHNQLLENLDLNRVINLRSQEIFWNNWLIELYLEQEYQKLADEEERRDQDMSDKLALDAEVEYAEEVYEVEML